VKGIAPFLLLSSLFILSSCTPTKDGSQVSRGSSTSSSGDLGILSNSGLDGVVNVDTEVEVKDIENVTIDKEVSAQEILDFGTEVFKSVELEKNFIVESSPRLNSENKQEMDNLSFAANATISVTGYELIDKSVKDMNCAAGDATQCP
jgi:hypothetical protein